jgi:hypothetical protein
MRSLGCPRSARWLVVAAALAVAPMAGAGPKPLAVVAAPPSPASGLPQEGDFNGDIYADLAVLDASSGSVAMSALSMNWTWSRIWSSRTAPAAA